MFVGLPGGGVLIWVKPIAETLCDLMGWRRARAAGRGLEMDDEAAHLIAGARQVRRRRLNLQMCAITEETGAESIPRTDLI